MDKNYPKYDSYRNAIEQINAAISARFFLEAITIEESILSDRLLRFCRDYGFNTPLKRVTLGRELDHLKSRLQLLNEHEFSLLDELNQFWINRCECLHQISKSEPGEPTLDFTEIYTLAEQTAINGKLLVKEVGNWAAKYKRRQINHKP